MTRRVQRADAALIAILVLVALGAVAGIGVLVSMARDHDTAVRDHIQTRARAELGPVDLHPLADLNLDAYRPGSTDRQVFALLRPGDGPLLSRLVAFTTTDALSGIDALAAPTGTDPSTGTHVTLCRVTATDWEAAYLRLTAGQPAYSVAAECTEQGQWGIVVNEGAREGRDHTLTPTGRILTAGPAFDQH